MYIIFDSTRLHYISTLSNYLVPATICTGCFTNYKKRWPSVVWYVSENSRKYSSRYYTPVSKLYLIVANAYNSKKSKVHAWSSYTIKKSKRLSLLRYLMFTNDKLPSKLLNTIREIQIAVATMTGHWALGTGHSRHTTRWCCVSLSSVSFVNVLYLLCIYKYFYDTFHTRLDRNQINIHPALAI